jgi:hypothetical protein
MHRAGAWRFLLVSPLAWRIAAREQREELLPSFH